MIQRIFQNSIPGEKGKKPKKTRKGVAFLRLIAVCFVFIVFLGIGIFGYFSKDLPSLAKIEKKENIQPSRIYDRTGGILLFEIRGEQEKILTPLSEISPWIQKATVASEDSNFYRHFGLNFKAIIRAVINNIEVKLGLKERRTIQGGSTITQQVIKMTLLTPERTLARKIKEAILSLELEFRYSKDQILEIYLNQAFYGFNSYGAEAASRLYFGKPAKELSLAESAILAAIPNAPTRLFPYGSHLDELFARQEYILERMVNSGFISKEEKETAKKQIPRFASKFSGLEKAPHFVMHVRDYLEQNYGEEYLKKGGLKIYTTIDWELQKAAEEIIKKGVEKNEKSKAYNGALVAIDPKTGQVLAMVGSKDYFASPYPEGCQPGENCLFDPNVNVAISNRQPGSAFKPFVYARAFQKGYAPQTVLFDVQTEFNPACPADASLEKSGYGLDCYHPQNYDGKFRGPVSLKSALAQSLNVPSVKTLYLAGIENALSLARELGISTLDKPESYYGLSLVLGGGEVKLLDLTAAYGVFATNGILNKKTIVLKIEDKNGKSLEEFRPSPQIVLEEKIAHAINNILSDNEARAPMFGENSSLKIEGRPAAVKTGTSQDYHDAWTIGYTPSLVCGIWVGNNDNTPIEKKAGGYIAAPLWNEFIRKAYEIKSAKKNPPDGNFALPTEIEEFVQPEPEIVEKTVLNGEFIQKTTVEIDKISGKLAGPLTPQELIEKKDFQEIHTILRYIDKDDPRSEAPQNPTLDSQYENWGEGIKKWLESSGNELIKNLQIEIPPKLYDDLHTEENLPEITIFSPLPLAIYDQNYPLTTKVFVKAPLGLGKIEYLFDGNLLDSKFFLPSEREKEIENSLTLPKNLEKGGHLLKIKITDSVKNQTEKENQIVIN